MARPEGIYCRWETYPPEGGPDSSRLLTIERVTGNATVEKIICTTDESVVVMESVAEEIGDYASPSLFAWLIENYRLVSPDGSAATPRDMILEITQAVQHCRR
jgi:hypothetical protein